VWFMMWPSHAKHLRIWVKCSFLSLVKNALFVTKTVLEVGLDVVTLQQLLVNFTRPWFRTRQVYAMKPLLLPSPVSLLHVEGQLSSVLSLKLCCIARYWACTGEPWSVDALQTDQTCQTRPDKSFSLSSRWSPK